MKHVIYVQNAGMLITRLGCECGWEHIVVPSQKGNWPTVEDVTEAAAEHMLAVDEWCQCSYPSADSVSIKSDTCAACGRTVKSP